MRGSPWESDPKHTLRMTALKLPSQPRPVSWKRLEVEGWVHLAGDAVCLGTSSTELWSQVPKFEREPLA